MVVWVVNGDPKKFGQITSVVETGTKVSTDMKYLSRGPLPLVDMVWIDWCGYAWVGAITTGDVETLSTSPANSSQVGLGGEW